MTLISRFSAEIDVARRSLALFRAAVDLDDVVDARMRDSCRARTISFVGEVFRGSAALRDGRLTAHELRRWYRPILRDVYVPRFLMLPSISA